MIRVCHLITSLATGGAETALFRLLTHTDRSRFSMTAISITDGGTYGPMLAAAGIPVHTLEMSRGRFNPRGFGKLVRVLRQERPHVIQTWLYHADLIGTAAARFCGSPPVLWNIRCSVTDERYVKGQAGAVVGLLARLSRQPRVVVSNSHAGQAVHATLGYRPRSWAIIPNGIDIDTFRPSLQAREDLRKELGLSRDAILIGLVARFDPLKDHGTFLRAAAQVVSRHSDVHFIAVGADVDSSNRYLASLSEELGLGPNLHLLGERRDTPQLNAAFDIATCTSLGEGFPNVLIEAMACGTPCISTAVGDAALVIGSTGLVVAPANPNAFAMALLNLIEAGRDYRMSLGGEARLRTMSMYSLTTMVERYQDLYASIAS